MEDFENSLSHCKWNCKYHIVFAPKYRRKAIYDKIKVDIGQILRKLCKWKGVEIIEAELCPDHVHMLVKIPPKYSVATFMGYLKGKSTLMIFDRHANLKYKYGRQRLPRRIQLKGCAARGCTAGEGAEECRRAACLCRKDANKKETPPRGNPAAANIWLSFKSRKFLSSLLKEIS